MYFKNGIVNREVAYCLHLFLPLVLLFERLDFQLFVFGPQHQRRAGLQLSQG